MAKARKPSMTMPMKRATRTIDCPLSSCKFLIGAPQDGIEARFFFRHPSFVILDIGNKDANDRLLLIFGAKFLVGGCPQRLSR
jgi:hypothetical protein